MTSPLDDHSITGESRKRRRRGPHAVSAPLSPQPNPLDWPKAPITSTQHSTFTRLLSEPGPNDDPCQDVPVPCVWPRGAFKERLPAALHDTLRGEAVWLSLLLAQVNQKIWCQQARAASARRDDTSSDGPRRCWDEPGWWRCWILTSLVLTCFGSSECFNFDCVCVCSGYCQYTIVLFCLIFIYLV